MTNEEIRNNYDKIWFEDAKSLENGKYLLDMFDFIQEDTCKDERERVCNEFQEAINEAGLGTFKIWEILTNIKLKSLE